MSAARILHGRMWIDGGYRPVVCKIGYKWGHAVFMDGGKIRAKRFPARDTRYIKEVAGYGTPRKMARAMLKKNPLFSPKKVTRTARAILNRAINNEVYA